MSHVTSEYSNDSVLVTPRAVTRWEAQINSAATATEAQSQLLYLQLVQLHKIRVLLVWGLFIVPALAGVVVVITILAR